MTYRLLAVTLLGGALLVGSCLHGAPPAASSSPEPLAAHPPPAATVAEVAPVAAAAAEAPSIVAEAAAASTAPTASVAEPAPAEAAAAEAPARIDFATEIQPLLEGCRPCHFEGGKMYEELPFDDPATVRLLGERLFTRIKEEEAQALIRAFLAQEG